MISANHGRDGIRVFDNDPDLIIKGGMILTMRAGQNPIQKGEIFIKNGKITGIHASGTKFNGGNNSHAEIINAKEAIIMPGLINGHTHAAMTLFRGLADDLPLKQWLFEKIFPAEARFLNTDTVYWGSLLGCLEMIASGTTCFMDGYFFQDATVRAAHESGLRALIAQGVIDFPAPGVEDPEKNIKIAKEFIERWLGFSDRIMPGIFCHSPLTCSKQTLKDAWEISQQFDLPLQIHLSETTDEVNEILKKTGKRPVHYLEEIGLINDGLIAAHAVHLDDGEIERLKENGVRVVHVPESNMKLSSGVARILDMVKKEIPIGLGTDGCSSNNNLDLFQEMDTAAKLSKVFSLDPVALDAETVLRMTTTWGASVIGLGDQVGTLELGKKADIIVVDLQGPNLCPVYDPLSALVYAASGADVKDVIVDGKVLMKDRIFTTLDADEIMGRVKRISADITI
jgi:5-methylthioadenosine/S-adenosylhomocysteine deaminase